jgi:hypothetical protein
MSSFDWGGSGGSGSSPDANSSTKGLIKLTNNLGGTADLPEVVDLTITNEQFGSILYNNGLDWVQLSPGISGQFLSTNGVGSSPTWNNLSNKGTASLNFGAAPGGNYASVNVTGQTGISTSSSIKVWVSESTTADHNGFEHLMLNMASGISFGNVINNVGFTIYVLTELRLSGAFLINWEWV